MTTTNTTTYLINCTDTEAPTAWHSAPGIVRATPGAQDGGRCRWEVATIDPIALEEALEADDAVIRYAVVWSPDRNAARAVEWGEIESYYHDDAEIERKRADWADSGESWESERDEAAAAPDRETAIGHLSTMRQIEQEWGDCPATLRVAAALGIDDAEVRQ